MIISEILIKLHNPQQKIMIKVTIIHNKLKILNAMQIDPHLQSFNLDEKL